MYGKFCLNLSNEKEADVVIFGTLLGKNAKKMLESLRKTSWFVEWFDIDEEENLVEKVKVADIGDVDARKIEKVVKRILDEGKIPFMISNSHLATYFSLKLFEKDVKVVSFDAHFDVKDNYVDEKMVKSVNPLKFNKEEMKKFNASTWARRSFEESRRNFCFIGVRSCDGFDLEFVKNKGFLYFTPKMIRENLGEVKKKLGEFCQNNKIYLTVDIDVFDPSVAPAVGHPEPDGIFWFQFQELIKEVFKGKVLGLDLVEINPIKGNEVTEFLGNKIISECLSLLKSN
ncbi:MAG: arginase family protein [Candidatus Aenigmatarchaeota archaeon]